MLQAPHVFLHANEATSVCLQVPFYANTYLASTPGSQESDYVTKLDSGPAKATARTHNYATVELYVVNPLSVSTSGTSTVSISVHGIITDAEFYVPSMPSPNYTDMEGESLVNSITHIPTQLIDTSTSIIKKVTGDFIDMCRSGIRNLTGFHNPNSSTVDKRVIYTNRNFHNNVDIPIHLEKLDPYALATRVVRDAKFETEVDEMDVQQILKKPCFVATCKILNTNNSGALLFAHPITPMIGALESTVAAQYTPMRLFYEGSRFWRGSLKLKLQSCMNNFQFFKVMVVLDYKPNKNWLQKKPSMNDCENLITHTLEFSAGGQIHEIDMPYVSDCNMLECTKSYEANALMHGLVRIYLLQTLINNGTSPNTVYLNVYMSAGDDLQFYGYTNDTFRFGNVEQTADDFVGESNEVVTTVGVSSQDPIVDASDNNVNYYANDYMPIVSVRDIFRRMTPCIPISINFTADDKGVKIVRLSDIIYSPTGSGQVFSNAMNLFRSMFLGYTGGLRIKLVFRGKTTISGVKYVPPSFYNEGNGFYASQILPSVTKLKDRFYQCERSTPEANPSTVPYIDFPQATSVVANTSSNEFITIFEFEIPNMSPFRFTGNQSVNRQLSDPGEQMCNAMGHLLITSNLDGDTVLIPSIAYTDDCRFGYQVLAPVFQPKYVIDGSDKYRYSIC